jgi:hypothetical protein
MNAIATWMAAVICGLALTACGGGYGDDYGYDDGSGDDDPSAFLTVTVNVGAGGNIYPGGHYAGFVHEIPGMSETFTISPDPGYGIASVGGTCGGTLNGNTYMTHPIDNDCTVTVTFKIPLTITASAGAGGTISPSGVVTVGMAGIPEFFTITPDPGYRIVLPVGGTCSGSMWDRGGVYEVSTYTDCAVEAAFSQ